MNLLKSSFDIQIQPSFYLTFVIFPVRSRVCVGRVGMSSNALMLTICTSEFNFIRKWKLLRGNYYRLQYLKLYKEPTPHHLLRYLCAGVLERVWTAGRSIFIVTGTGTQWRGEPEVSRTRGLQNLRTQGTWSLKNPRTAQPTDPGNLGDKENLKDIEEKGNLGNLGTHGGMRWKTRKLGEIGGSRTENHKG